MIEPAADVGLEAGEAGCEVGEILAHRVEHAVVLVAELAGFLAHFTSIAVRAAGQHPGGSRVLFGVAHPLPQVTNITFQGSHTRFEVR